MSEPSNARLEVLLESLDRRLEDLDHKLFGNGQPGELALIKGRLTALEEFKWRALGALAVVVIGFELYKSLKG